jgi:hypothetical protein
MEARAQGSQEPARSRARHADGMATIGIKRVYDPDSPRDGRRILVERLWPRGIRKEDLQRARRRAQQRPRAARLPDGTDTAPGKSVSPRGNG